MRQRRSFLLNLRKAFLSSFGGSGGKLKPRRRWGFGGDLLFQDLKRAAARGIWG
jgi:hypothetical protein